MNTRDLRSPLIGRLLATTRASDGAAAGEAAGGGGAGAAAGAAAAAAAAAGTLAAASGAAGASADKPFYESYESQDLRTHPSLHRYKSHEEVAKSYVELEKRF